MDYHHDCNQLPKPAVDGQLPDCRDDRHGLSSPGIWFPVGSRYLLIINCHEKPLSHFANRPQRASPHLHRTSLKRGRQGPISRALLTQKPPPQRTRTRDNVTESSSTGSTRLGPGTTRRCHSCVIQPDFINHRQPQNSA